LVTHGRSRLGRRPAERRHLQSGLRPSQERSHRPLALTGSFPCLPLGEPISSGEPVLPPQEAP